MFDDSLKTTSTSFFIADFNLLNCELTLHINHCIESFYRDIILNQNEI